MQQAKDQSQAIAPCKVEVKKCRIRENLQVSLIGNWKEKWRKNHFLWRLQTPVSHFTGKQDKNGRKEIKFSRENNILRINCCWINQKLLGVLSKQPRKLTNCVDFLGLCGENNKSSCVKNRSRKLLGYFRGFVKKWRYRFCTENQGLYTPVYFSILSKYFSILETFLNGV